MIFGPNSPGSIIDLTDVQIDANLKTEVTAAIDTNPARFEGLCYSDIIKILRAEFGITATNDDLFFVLYSIEQDRFPDKFQAITL